MAGLSLGAEGLLRHLDWHVHLCWLQGFHDGLTQGTWYPRWIDGANEGQGGPVFLYYAPLAYYVGSGFMALGAHVAAALKAVYALSLLACAGGLYAWLRPVVGSARAVAFAGFGLLTPQLTLFAYSYNMPASALAVGVLPWVGWALERHGSAARRIAALAAALAVLLLSHTLTGFQVLLLLAVAGGVALCGARNRIGALRVLLPAALLALALAAVYLLPLAGARDLIHAEHLIESPQWRITTNLQFGWLFGGAPAGQGPIEFDLANGCGLIALLLAVGRLAGRGAGAASRPWMAWSGAALLVFLLMTPVATPLYDNVEVLRYLQFGWRWQALFLLCVLRVVAEVFRLPAAEAAAHSPQNVAPPSLAAHSGAGDTPSRRIARVASGLAITACALGIVVCLFRIMQPFAETGASQRVALAEATRFAERCAWPMLEYRPRAMGPEWRRELNRQPQRPTVLSGRAHIAAADVRNETKRYDIVADLPSRIVFPVLDFPGWTLQTGDAPVEPAQPLRDGRIAIDLPRGRHHVVLRFEPPDAVRAGGIVSAVALLVWLGLSRGVVRGRRGERSADSPGAG